MAGTPQGVLSSSVRARGESAAGERSLRVVSICWRSWAALTKRIPSLYFRLSGGGNVNGIDSSAEKLQFVCDAGLGVILCVPQRQHEAQDILLAGHQ